MKKIFLYFLTSITIIYCTSDDGQSVPIFNGIIFKLNNSEEVLKIDTDKKNIFNSYFNKMTVQIPLYRCIKSDSHMIFVGFPLNTTVKELSNQKFTTKLNQTFFEGDSSNYFYKTYSNKKEHITIYTRNFSDNLVYLLTVTNSSVISDSLFNLKELSNRFKQNKI